MSQPAHCSHCGKPLVVIVEIDDGPVIEHLRRIEHLIRNQGREISMDIHEEIAEAVGPVLAAVFAVSTDVAQALADFANQVAPKLSDDEKAQFAGLAQQLLDLDSTVKAADPGDGSTPPVEPAPGGEGAGE